MTPRNDRYYAHSAPPDSAYPWHGLVDHLHGTGDRAARSLERLDLAELGRVAGLLHDLGKFTPEFQNRLRGAPAPVNHSTAGANVACQRYPGPLGKLIAFCVAGHHAGLANGVNGDKTTALVDRLRQKVPDLDPVWRDEIALPLLTFPNVQPRGRDSAGITASFLVRLVFSALVDGDYLDTEAYYDGAGGTASPRGEHPSLEVLRQRLDSHLAKFNTKARSPVNDLRAEVLAHARQLAGEPPGLFTLTVPTGGGKTLTSLAFALDHAVRHGLDRVIYVIPYTNIIEQTADVFREALGAAEPDAPDPVVEHHSAFDEDRIEERSGRQKLRLAMENWDAPVVVTTAVQFFESLFANRPSRCRKLHNVAGSVVVLDETQTLPLGFLRPCVAAMDELSRNWRASLVLCSATPPALTEESGFAGGLRDVRELAPEPVRLQARLRRTRLRSLGSVTEDELAGRLQDSAHVLCIVNTRRRARAVYEAIRDHEGATHLTTLMCARHRRNVLTDVRSRLQAGEPIRLVATSLIEAGVDLDFPVALREEAGLESIIQAAGRCNREGRTTCGDVFVFGFPAEDGRALPEIAKAAGAARSVLRKHDDPTSLEAIREYFRTLYWVTGDKTLDQKGILALLCERTKSLDFPFETIAREFRLIETPMVPVIVPYRGPDGTDRAADGLIRELDFAERPGGLARQLQPYTVPVPPQARAVLLSAGSVRIVQEARFGEQFVVLENEDIYRDDIGLTWDDPTFRRAEGMVI